MLKIYDLVARSMAQASSIDDISSSFNGCMSTFDLDCYAYQVVHHNYLSHMKNHVITTYPLEWQSNYFEQNYFDTDPLVNKFLTQAEPFFWKEGTFAHECPKAKKMLKESSDFNLQTGIGIPIPGPNGSFSILTLCSSNLTSKEMSEIYSHYYQELTMCSLLYHSSFISLNLDNHLFNNYELTNKELDTLKWLCEGKSDAVIACILGVSTNTIKARVKNIYKKMGAYNRIEAALKAYRYKIVDC